MVDVLVLDFKTPDAIDLIKSCDGAMWHWFHNPDDKQSAYAILNSIEFVLQRPVWPNYYTRWHFDDKISQAYFFKSLGIPHAKTWVFWNKEQADSFLEEVTYPIVLKLKSGAGSANVILIKGVKDGKSYVNAFFNRGIFPYTFNEHKIEGITLKSRLKTAIKSLLGISTSSPSTYWDPQKNYVLFQEFLQGNEYDTRITVIGKRLFGFRRFNRENDFRASGSGKIDYNPDFIENQMLLLARNLSIRQKFQCMSYDFLIRDGVPVLIEMSYGFSGQALYQCPGHWDFNMNWHQGKMWPEEAQVLDFLASI